MSEVATLAPVTTSKTRIVALDVLRGIAILGILVPNIVSFGLPGAASMPNPGVGTEGVDAWVEVLRAVFFSGKFRGMLSILFGVGLAMQFRKLSAPPPSSSDPFPLGYWPDRYLRRTILLMVIGLVHFMLIWYGDILFVYSLAAFFAIAFVKVQDRAVLITAGVILGLSILLGFALGALLLLIGESGASEAGIPDVLTKESEFAAYAEGSILDQLKHRLVLWAMMLFALPFAVPEIVGGFLLGLLLGRHSLLVAPSEHPKWTRLALIVGFGAGVPLTVLPLLGFMGGTTFNFAMPLEMGGGVVLGLGYIVLGAVVIEKMRGSALLKPMANVGRLALSCYLLQSVLLTSVFYSWGGGLYGQFSVTELLGFVVGTWIVVIVFAAVWSRYFQFGPVEWLWRSLTYKTWLSIKSASSQS